MQLIKWNLKNDTFEFGQWFKGTIELAVTDLSPDGGLLVYFALKHKGPFPSWTAISKPPYFTALAIWPIEAVLGGGGVFVSNREVRLNHAWKWPDPLVNSKPGQIRIKPNLASKSQPEEILRRDGWTLVQQGRFRPIASSNSWTGQPPEVWGKPHPKRGMRLEMHILDLARWGNQNLHFRVANDEGEILMEMDAGWADWDHHGTLLYAQQGRLFRRRPRHIGFSEPDELIDLTERKFQEVPPPAWATHW